MAYDNDITGSILELQLKRKVWRVNFERDAGDGAPLTANCYLREDTIDATTDSVASGSVLVSKDWIIDMTRPQILNLNNAGNFLNSLINTISSLKDEYDASGSLATGSIRPLM